MLKRALQELIIAIVRPYVSRELPGWGRVYQALVGSYHRDWLWAGSPPQVVRGKIHGFDMPLDISKWPDRSTFFLGRWYDLNIQMLIGAALRRGDVVVDVGANRGMFALAASHRVGPEGRVVCFEPNPQCVEILNRDLRLNSITNVTVMNIGLSDEDTELALSIPRINSGEASFGFSAYSDAYKISVPVRIGDQMLADVMPSVIKIDVEGYEPRVMKGLVDTIRRSHPLIITEVVGHHLIRCGSSVEALLDGMTELGYEGFRFSALRNGKDFHLTRITAVGQEDCDIAWLHSESEVYARLRTLVRAR